MAKGSAAATGRGRRVYKQACAVWPHGGGHRRPQHAADLTRSAVVKGSPQTFIDVVLRGRQRPSPPTGKKYSK